MPLPLPAPPDHATVFVWVGVGFGFPFQWAEAFEAVLRLQEQVRQRQLPITLLCPMPTAVPATLTGPDISAHAPEEEWLSALEKTREDLRLSPPPWVWLDRETFEAHRHTLPGWYNQGPFDLVVDLKALVGNVTQSHGPLMELVAIHEPEWIAGGILKPGVATRTAFVSMTRDAAQKEEPSKASAWTPENWAACFGETAYRFRDEWEGEMLAEWQAAFERKWIGEAAPMVPVADQNAMNNQDAGEGPGVPQSPVPGRVRHL
jgi:hypothetical protein